MRPVRIRILSMAACPATPAAIPLVENIARGLHVPISLERVLVETAEQAHAFAFLGSPTVRVGGRDIEPDAWSRTDFGLT